MGGEWGPRGVFSERQCNLLIIENELLRTYATMSQNSSVSSSVMVNGNGTRSASGIQSQSSPASTACVYYCEIVGGWKVCVRRYF